MESLINELKKNRYKKTTKAKITLYLIFIIDALHMMPTILLIASGGVELIIQDLKIHKLITRAIYCMYLYNL